ncbi:LOW QUALITY PROTEIN: methylthioribose kinase-like [Saccostrea echinata]|uniref:LOW QUALITY PROTEIN: methylthioribose kinase-like n=1 Tax=Saccostrea echinata TaxID=191078 RepID=UPI002A7FD12A|nr:LOW QUALITY PROTEIN: methylthioribose kinase-like [Saccostrea echinata]
MATWDKDQAMFIGLLDKYSQLDQLKSFSGPDTIELTSAGDGNLNDVIRAKKSGQSIIFKRAPPYIKCLGPEYPLEPSRGQTEYDALCVFSELALASVPRPYFYDHESRTICMEDLVTYKDFRKQLISGICCMEAVEKLARDIGKVHNQTHVAKISERSFSEYKSKFQDTELVKLTEQYIFTKPFDKFDSTNKLSDDITSSLSQLYDNPRVLDVANDMKHIFLTKKECLVHGDLHTGSVMVNGADTKIIDLEFAYIGPAALDIGLLLANYIFSYYGHMSIPEDHDRHRKFAQLMIEACKVTVNKYLEEMTSFVGEQQTYQDKLLSEMAGFAGCELIRRVVGAAPVEDLHSPYSKQDALGAGVRLLLGRHNITTVDKLLVIALMLV